MRNKDRTEYLNLVFSDIKKEIMTHVRWQFGKLGSPGDV